MCLACPWRGCLAVGGVPGRGGGGLACPIRSILTAVHDAICVPNGRVGDHEQSLVLVLRVGWLGRREQQHLALLDAAAYALSVGRYLRSAGSLRIQHVHFHRIAAGAPLEILLQPERLNELGSHTPDHRTREGSRPSRHADSHAERTRRTLGLAVPAVGGSVPSLDPDPLAFSLFALELFAVVVLRCPKRLIELNTDFLLQLLLHFNELANIAVRFRRDGQDDLLFAEVLEPPVDAELDCGLHRRGARDDEVFPVLLAARRVAKVDQDRRKLTPDRLEEGKVAVLDQGVVALFAKGHSESGALEVPDHFGHLGRVGCAVLEHLRVNVRGYLRRRLHFPTVLSSHTWWQRWRHSRARQSSAAQ